MVFLFGVTGSLVQKYDSEFRGFTEFGVTNSVNPFDSLSYPPNNTPKSRARAVVEGRVFSASACSVPLRLCAVLFLLGGNEPNQGTQCHVDRIRVWKILSDIWL